jgi:hypothetical protein
MSQLINRFDPSDVSLLDPTGKGIITTNGHNPGEQLVLYNSSLTCFKIVFLDKTEDVMPPCWARSYKKPGSMGNLTYVPIFTLSLLTGAQPISTCYGTLYESFEHVDDLNVPLSYVTNVGNTGGIPVSTSSIANDGNAAGTVFLEATPSGGGSSTVTIDNSGNVVCQDLLIKGGKIGDAASGDILDASATTDTYLKTRASGTIHFQVPGGTNVCSINDSASPGTANGNNGGLTVDKVFFFLGAIKSINGDINIACGSGTTISHGLGGTPGFLSCMMNIAQPGSGTNGLGSVGSTTFRATIGAGSALAWIGGR